MAEAIESTPIVVVRACDVPGGKMPTKATAMVRRALELGLKVRSTYSVVFAPGVLRGGMRVTVTQEWIVVRFKRVETGWAAFGAWVCEDGGAWGFDAAWVREPGRWPRRVNANGVYV